MCEESAFINMEQEQENYKKIDEERPNFFKIVRKLAMTCNKYKINFKEIERLKETRFRHKVAIQKLLKRSPQTLFVENKNGKTALDITDAQDLEKYFDFCVVLDRYALDFSATDYKMLFRFKSLINSRNSENDEVAIVSRISKRKHLEQLLIHPLIHTFIVLKWSKMEKYYWMILLLQEIIIRRETYT
ncbi:transient receptor potential cation channel protein painless-like isoform X3 [Zophobas morio]|uniref:transient receptor potential cation channel protein painless-like isoform X3 n=1 Tax=Zophobas morio TaxID=2755281 RepID=UPI00308396CD